MLLGNPCLPMLPGWSGNSRRGGGSHVSEGFWAPVCSHSLAEGRGKWQWVGLASRDLPAPPLTCQLAEQALVAAGICWVGGTGHQHFPFPWDSTVLGHLDHMFWFPFLPSVPGELGRGPQS